MVLRKMNPIPTSSIAEWNVLARGLDQIDYQDVKICSYVGKCKDHPLNHDYYVLEVTLGEARNWEDMDCRYTMMPGNVKTMKKRWGTNLKSVWINPW